MDLIKHLYVCYYSINNDKLGDYKSIDNHNHYNGDDDCSHDCDVVDEYDDHIEPQFRYMHPEASHDDCAIFERIKLYYIDNNGKKYNCRISFSKSDIKDIIKRIKENSNGKCTIDTKFNKHDPSRFGKATL